MNDAKKDFCASKKENNYLIIITHSTLHEDVHFIFRFTSPTELTSKHKNIYKFPTQLSFSSYLYRLPVKSVKRGSAFFLRFTSVSENFANFVLIFVYGQCSL